MEISEAQYRGALEWVARFTAELAELEAGRGPDVSEQLRGAMIAGTRSMIRDLREQIDAYETAHRGTGSRE